MFDPPSQVPAGLHGALTVCLALSRHQRMQVTKGAASILSSTKTPYYEPDLSSGLLWNIP